MRLLHVECSRDISNRPGTRACGLCAQRVSNPLLHLLDAPYVPREQRSATPLGAQAGMPVFLDKRTSLETWLPPSPTNERNMTNDRVSNQNAKMSQRLRSLSRTGGQI